MVETALNLIMLCGAFLAAVLALGQAAAQRPFRDRMITGGTFLCIAFLLSGSVYYASGFQSRFPHLILMDLPFFYCIGPLLTLNFNLILKKTEKLNPAHLLHFIPAALCFLIFLLFLTKSPAEKIHLMEIGRHSRWTPQFWIMATNLPYFLSVFHISGYLLLFLYKSRQLWSRTVFKRQPLVFHLFLFTLAAITTFFLNIIALSLDSMTLVRIFNSLATPLLIWFYLIGQRFPEMFPTLEKEITRLKYENSQLKGYDIDALIKKVDRLVTEKEIYRQEDLTLNELAAQTELTAHQLSELLNDCLGKSFKEYINGYRVEKAKELLRNNTEKLIIDVAFESGFRSQSTFYTAFSRFTGVKPKEYREM